MNADVHNSLTGPDGDEPGAWISALADGDARALDPACQHWRDDATARQTWHAYHLIGDVMRSEELATTPARDAAFLASLRQRLAQEPVVLAPAPAAATKAAVAPRRRQPWLLPAAAAAGFALVASVMVVSRLGSDPATAPAMAAASGAGLTAAAPQALAQSQLNLIPAQTALVSDREGVLRDVRLEEYLRAHQATRGGTMVVAPGGTLRRVDVQVAPAGQAR
jgi:sigma-E factor negative regulatory protein RseA